MFEFFVEYIGHPVDVLTQNKIYGAISSPTNKRRFIIIIDDENNIREVSWLHFDLYK